MNNLKEKLINNRFVKSIFRHDFVDTTQNRSQRVFNNFLLHMHPVKVKKHGLKMSYTFCLGGISAALFIILSVTGILLMLYYHPSIPQAYNDMKDLEFVVSSGMFLRNLHRIAAHLMVVSVFLHMLRVFYTGSYKPPREFNWVVGVLLFILTLFLSFTGYLLPWDQLSYWAITVGTTIASYFPFIGKTIRFLLLGGNIVGENALLRFYVLHCVILPVFIMALMAIHFWRIRKDGGISGPL